jgi:hypothetical protein
MDLDRGTLAKIDRKLLAGLGNDETFRTLRVPSIRAKWSTWKRHCDSVGISMGRAVTMPIDRDLISVLGDITSSEMPGSTQRATEPLAIREAKVVARESEVDTEEARMRELGERLRRREDELEVCEQLAEFASKITSRHSTDYAKIGRNERCPAGQASSTSTAMACVIAGHPAGYGCVVGRPSGVDVGIGSHPEHNKSSSLILSSSSVVMNTCCSALRVAPLVV